MVARFSDVAGGHATVERAAGPVGPGAEPPPFGRCRQGRGRGIEPSRSTMGPVEDSRFDLLIDRILVEGTF